MAITVLGNSNSAIRSSQSVTMQSDLANQIFSSNEILVRCICQVIRLITFNALDTLFSTSSPAHLFNIRGKRKRGPGTVQIRD